ncbi:MAG: TIGR04211 family SH3 domain-containing protein [Gammaproteobacteria bacterium]|nr:TIGR04211 family SH3 domain-containing protein [Gammaproteobacteria bacterium]
MKKLVLLLVLSVSATAVTAQQVRYVEDFVKVPLRTGKSLQNKILRMLPSGTRLELLEVSEEDGYSRVKTERGVEGWILSRYLMEQPSARDRLATAKEELAAEKEAAERLKREIGTLRAHEAEIERSNRELQENNSQLSQELASIRRTASRALAIEEENARFREEVAQRKEELDTLLRQNAVLKDQSRRDWFVAGAGVVLGGLLLGLIIPRIPWRRRKRWDQF